MTATEHDADRLKAHNRELSILKSVAEALNQTVDLHQALDVVLSQVAELLGLTTGWIWLLDEDTAEPYLVAARELPVGLKPPETMQGPCWCLDSFRVGKLDSSTNISVVSCSRLKDLVHSHSGGLKCHASVPLLARGRKVGLLNVASSDWRKLTEAELKLLYTVGDMLGMAVERARAMAHSAHLGATEERNRLAREIHDTIAQGMAAAALHLESAEALLEANAEVDKVHKAIEKALGLTRQNLEEARRSVLDLRAAPLEGRTLSQAIRALVDHLEGLETDLSTSGLGPISTRLEVGVYRIAQEALGNVIKHACASRVSLSLTQHLGHLHLSIQDNGRGFEPQRVAQGECFGLVGLQERARLLGGRLEVASEPGLGTHIQVWLPLEEAR